MGSLILPNLPSAWHVDQAILSEPDRLVVIRFGNVAHPDCLRQDDVLSKIAEQVKNFAVVYLCDIDQVPEFNSMYELYDPMTIMFFFRNKHMMCDFGTGNNNKLNWVLYVLPCVRCVAFSADTYAVASGKINRNSSISSRRSIAGRARAAVWSLVRRITRRGIGTRPRPIPMRRYITLAADATISFSLNGGDYLPRMAVHAWFCRREGVTDNLARRRSKVLAISVLWRQTDRQTQRRMVVFRTAGEMRSQQCKSRADRSKRALFQDGSVGVYLRLFYRESRASKTDIINKD